MKSRVSKPQGRDDRDEPGVLARVGQLLRDRALLEAAAPGLADYRASRTVPLGDDLLAELRRP